LVSFSDGLPGEKGLLFLPLPFSYIAPFRVCHFPVPSVLLLHRFFAISLFSPRSPSFPSPFLSQSPPVSPFRCPTCSAPPFPLSGVVHIFERDPPAKKTFALSGTGPRGVGPPRLHTAKTLPPPPQTTHHPPNVRVQTGAVGASASRSTPSPHCRKRTPLGWGLEAGAHTRGKAPPGWVSPPEGELCNRRVCLPRPAHDPVPPEQREAGVLTFPKASAEFLYLEKGEQTVWGGCLES